MKCAFDFWFETLAMTSRAVAFTPTTYLDELGSGLKTSSFSKSKFSMGILFEWRNLFLGGRCKAVRIVSTIESVERTQLHCEECTQLRCAECIRLMNVPNCSALNVCSWWMYSIVLHWTYAVALNEFSWIEPAECTYMLVHADTCVQRRALGIFDWLRERTSQFTEVGYWLREWTVLSRKVGLRELPRYSAEEPPPWID